MAHVGYWAGKGITVHDMGFTLQRNKYAYYETCKLKILSYIPNRQAYHVDLQTGDENDGERVVIREVTIDMLYALGELQEDN